MMRTIKLRLSALIFLLWIAACTTPPTAPHIDRVIAFGDSNADNGNLYRLTAQTYPAPPRWKGRESDGPVAVEYLATLLHASLQDYAVSGASTGDSNIISRLSTRLPAIASTGMATQIEQFMHAGATLGNGDLVVLWAGSNDIFNVQRTERDKLDRHIASAISNLEQAIVRLHEGGARHIIVANRSPRPALGSDNDLNGIDLNTAIAHMVGRLRANFGEGIVLYDDYAAIADMINNPSRYGFSDVTDLCSLVPACAAQNSDTGTSIADTFVHWDPAHKTTRVHKLMAQQMAHLLSDQTGRSP